MTAIGRAAEHAKRFLLGQNLTFRFWHPQSPGRTTQDGAKAD